MNILITLNHPAHFHLFKNPIKELKKRGHEVQILAKTKDILIELLEEEGLEYENFLPKGRKDNSKTSMALEFLVTDFRILKLCLIKRPDIMIGSSKEICHVGKLLNIDTIFFCEDDIHLIPLLAKFALPYTRSIMAPHCVDFGKFEHKKIGYHGYHESAYLHPNNFTPSKDIASKYVDLSKPFFIIRFVKFTAHHDVGITGITKGIAIKIIEKLKLHGNIYITSERELEEELEPYRLKIKPNDIHHAMSFASMYIGDSQSMAMEAGVLGVPFIRFNDFVGRINVLIELEDHYKLGYGIRTDEEDKLYKTIDKLLEMEDREEIFAARKQNLLDNTIDLNEYLVNFLEDRAQKS